MTTNLPVPSTGDDMASLSNKVDLAAKYAMMQKMNEANSGGGGSGYSTAGKVAVKIEKSGIFLFTDPHTNQIVSAKVMTIIPVNTEFQLQRWLLDGETIDGYDSTKGPVCQSVNYTHLLTGQKTGRGYFDAPAWSPYHAAKMLPDLTGSGGHDGKQGPTLCKDCPMGQQNAKGACKPAGIMEFVIVAINDQRLVDAAGELRPIYAYIKLSHSNIVEYSKYLEQLKKGYDVGMFELVITKLEANSKKEGARTWGVISYYAQGRMNADTAAIRDNAVITTEKLLAEATQAASATSQPASSQQSNPPTSSSIPF